MSGEEHEKNGYINKSGYRIICVNGKQRAEHRVIMEKHIGRSLQGKEVVHHKNGIRDDNRIDNLEIFKSHSDHMKIHSDPRIMSKRGVRGCKIRWKDNPMYRINFFPSKNSWILRGRHGGKRTQLGSWKTKERAQQALRRIEGIVDGL